MLIAKRLLTYRANGIDSSLEIRIFALSNRTRALLAVSKLTSLKALA